MKLRHFFGTLGWVVSLAGCGSSVHPRSEAAKSAEAQTVKLSFVLTNDIHGHVENLNYLGGIVQQLRQKAEYKDGSAGLVVIDSGDQFQGTLSSNFDEGETIFKSLNEIGYDAIIPGNHDYDFGPLGWLFDKVRPGHPEDDARGVIKKVAGIAKFPMLSANTYVKAGLHTRSSGAMVPVDDQCRPSQQSLTEEIDFKIAPFPSFLKPYLITNKAGIRVALIGLDNHATTSVTTADNVSDLCFRDELATYLEIRKSLEGQADVFVLLLHGGNVGPGQNDASDLAEKINAAYPGGVDLIAAGHTHQIHNAVAGGVHVVQDGANGIAYGRVDLFYDVGSKKVSPSLTQSAAGIAISGSKCDSITYPFVCAQLVLPVQALPSITQIIADATAKIAPLAKRKLGTALTTLQVNRVNENALGNILTDGLRKATGTQVAIMNNGGIRTSIKMGEILFENLFEVSPFQNQAVIISNFPWKNLKGVLLAAARTCGKYGSLSESGLKIQYSRSCGTSSTVDANAKLLRVETVTGEVLYDEAAQVEVAADRAISVTTLDFLATGTGDGYSDFAGTVIDSTAGIARDLIAEQFAKDQPTFENVTDGRFVNKAQSTSAVH